MPVLALPAALIALVFGLVNSGRKEPNIALILLYVGFEGIFIGGISAIFEQQFPGSVTQAVIASFIVVAITLFLFTNGKVRETPKMTKFFLIAISSYLLFSLVNVGMILTGLPPECSE